MFIALILLTMIFYVQSESQPLEPKDEEVTQSAMGLPEEKIIRFVVDKFADVMRLFPQKSQVKASD